MSLLMCAVSIGRRKQGGDAPTDHTHTSAGGDAPTDHTHASTGGDAPTDTLTPLRVEMYPQITLMPL